VRIARRSSAPPARSCPCCGGTELRSAPVLWPELIREWELSAEEVAYVDRQQGTACSSCGSNVRSMTLARAITRAFGFDGLLSAFVEGPGLPLEVLEVNPAGNLTQFLSRLPNHRLGAYPEVDLRRLPFPDGAFDLVVHSDTLEHVDGAVEALRECHRVLRPRGACVFTVPIIVGRLTRGRGALGPSYHNNSSERDPALLVRTEYGADAWTQVLEAGFTECTIVARDYPAGLALAARV
jgi:SAM-dependent methyltransferase